MARHPRHRYNLSRCGILPAMTRWALVWLALVGPNIPLAAAAPAGGVHGPATGLARAGGLQPAKIAVAGSGGELPGDLKDHPDCGARSHSAQPGFAYAHALRLSCNRTSRSGLLPAELSSGPSLPRLAARGSADSRGTGERVHFSGTPLRGPPRKSCRIRQGELWREISRMSQ